MPTRKTAEERLQELELQKKQIEARIKEITKKENEKERRLRTRRLIQNGALAEKYLKCEGASQEQFESLLQKIVSVERVRGIIEAGDTSGAAHDEI